MADYVLVHGGKSNGATWDKVTPLLEERGHRVFAPSLSSPESSTLSEHISGVCKTIEENDLDGFILAGHSYASFVITGVADRMPERIKRLVYIDSSVPASGKSLSDIFANFGIRFEDYSVPQDPPFLEPIFYDEVRMRKIPKTYIRCTQSEFAMVSRPTYEKLVENAERDDWDCFTLDSDHKCMDSHAVELVDLLLLKHEH